MLLMGICIIGPYNIIGTVINMDLGQHINRMDSVAKISSLIESIASLTTAIEMLIIPFIPFKYIFYLFSAECIIATYVLWPLFMD